MSVWGALMKMSRSFCSYVAWMALAFAIGVNGISGAFSENAPAQLSPTRSVSLKSCGWEPESRPVHQTGYVSLNIEFDHHGNLWSGYTKKLIQLIPRSAPEAGREYNIVELSGFPLKCAIRLSRPTTESSPVAIMFSANDSMLVASNDKLHLIDHDTLSDRAAFNLLRPSDHARYKVLQSPGRKSLVIVAEGFTKAESSYTWLDPDSLEVLHTCSYPPVPGDYVGLRSFADDGRFIEYNGSDVRMIHQWMSEGQYCSPKVESLPRYGRPEDVILLDSEIVYFFNDPMQHGHPSILVLDRAGSTIATLPGHGRKEMMDRSGNTAVSEDGRRVAVVIDTMAGGVQWLDISDHLVARRVDIYDTKTWSRIARIKLSVPGEAALAFTPGGKTLAVQIDDLVQLYDGLP